MNRKIISTQLAPPAIGPYSQAVSAGGFVFTSGQIPLDPSTGAVVAGGIAEQTERTLENLEAVLTAAGVGLRDVVSTQIYLTSLENYSVVNEIYGKRFNDAPPARATVQVSGLPKGVMVEISAVAFNKRLCD